MTKRDRGDEQERKGKGENPGQLIGGAQAAKKGVMKSCFGR